MLLLQKEGKTQDPRTFGLHSLLRYSFGALCGLLIFSGVSSAQGIPSGTTHKVTLTWQAPSPVSGSGTVAGYNIYRTPSGPPAYTKINASLVNGLTLVDSSVAAGSTYGYCATTVDSIGTESACTIPVSANVPSNPNPPTALTGSAN